MRIEGKDTYKWEHGHSPKGMGYWMFKIADEEKSFHGLFSEASKAALKYAKKNHPKVFSIKVLP
jgi:hypothetical protein